MSTSSAPSLPSTMRAAVLVKAGSDFEMRIEELRMPTPKRGEVLIRTKAYATALTSQPCECDCHTDVSQALTTNPLCARVQVWSVPL